MSTPMQALLDDQALDRIADRIADRINQQPTPPLLTADHAGELLNVPPSWLLAEARAERVPHVRLGRYVRFDPTELREWATNRQHHGPRPRTQTPTEPRTNGTR